MAGTTNHLRQYTSNFYYPFRFYPTTKDVSGTPTLRTLSEAYVIDFTASESAERNEIIVLPLVRSNVNNADNASYTISTPTPVTGNIEVYAKLELINGSGTKVNNWVKISTVDVTEGEMTSISPLFALQYVLIPSDTTFDIYVANNAVTINGQIPYVINQTFPVQQWGDLIGQPINTETLENGEPDFTYGLNSTDLVNKTQI